MFDKHVFVWTLLGALGASAQFLPPGWFNYQNARWSECQNYYATCAPTIPACARGLCAQCYNFGGSGFKSCCNQPTPYICFQNARGGGGAITTAPPPVTDVKQLACQSAGKIIQSCESATPDFTNLNNGAVASCLCYSGMSWQPQSFDQPWSSCIAFALTADTSDYQAWSSLAGFCSSIGDVVNSPASAIASTTPAASNPTTTAHTVATSTSTTASFANSAATPTSIASGADGLRLTNILFKMFAAAAISITAESLTF